MVAGARERMTSDLTPADDIFSSQAECDEIQKEKVEDIALSEIDPFPDHPFQVRDDEDMEKLIESIRDWGIRTPTIARKRENGRYELVSGHRRKHVAEMVGLDLMPVIVRDTTRDEAIVDMVDGNRFIIDTLEVAIKTSFIQQQ